MAYVLSKKDVANLIKEALDGDVMADDDQVCEFVKDLSSVITKHFGGEVTYIETDPNWQDAALIHIKRNDQCPEEGETIYDKYNPYSAECKR